MELHILNTLQNRSKNILVVKCDANTWKLLVPSYGLSQRKRSARDVGESQKGAGMGDTSCPPFFPRCLKETGKTATQVTPVYFILTGQRQVSKCTLSAFLAADMRTRFAILPTKEVFVLKAVC